MSNDWLGITGRVCVVTGAGSGIGRTIAGALADAGGEVIILDRDITAAGETAISIQERGGRASAVECDVSDPASVERAAATCEAVHGSCDLLVNNAALLRPGSLAALSLKDWNDLISVNLTGYFLCSQTFGRAMMRQRHGVILHVASISAGMPQTFSGAYSVSKAGILMLSRQLAVEWGEYGIRSNVVSPGMIRTPLTEEFYKDPEILARRSAMAPLQRIGTPEDIADTVLFLASERSSYISGREILLDGGLGNTLLTLIPRPGYGRDDHTSNPATASR